MPDFRPGGVTNVDEFGNPVFAYNYRTVSPDGYRKQSIKFTASAGEITIFDLAMTVDVRLRGGWSWIEDTAVWGDEVGLSVVDKDDVLGLFATYGLTVGEDVLQLSKYIVDVDVPPGGWSGYCVDPNTYADVITGLYLRAEYNSVGASDVKVIIHYDVYEVGAQ